MMRPFFIIGLMPKLSTAILGQGEIMGLSTSTGSNNATQEHDRELPSEPLSLI
jgi:hypothetical protein